ncbi:unnamed protein product [Vitrella brassicaformis CCMP3155]|uniref:Uncharacterized protein n=1 Tax=Vitrella brassicaformis (strain CCMP3155) TaxID=1169540 RepID=A0A0G4GG28_VITBC|nr:unnamed protein product [Vitrella brassicaformis CCMP3155]|eukprot:CEM28322.1 unnamed protein product [Vitrella brassicaformis CCMP3155]
MQRGTMPQQPYSPPAEDRREREQQLAVEPSRPGPKEGLSALSVSTGPLRERFMRLMLPVQQGGPDDLQHIKEPHLFTASWMEAIHTHQQLFQSIMAARQGHVGVMSVMYESKPDLLKWDPKLLDARSKFGTTPFIFAASGGHVDVLRALYAKGGKGCLTQKDQHGMTALHVAADRGQSVAVSQLLEWGGGALLDIKNNDGKTPWDFAVLVRGKDVGAPSPCVPRSPLPLLQQELLGHDELQHSHWRAVWGNQLVPT